MAILKVLKLIREQLRLGFLVGHRRSDEAIDLLTRNLNGSVEDGGRLALIAKLHNDAGRQDQAIDAAKKALVYDPTEFQAIELMSTVLAQRSEHDAAARYVRLGLENLPPPMPPSPQIFVAIAKGLGRFFPSLARIDDPAPTINRGREEWFEWGKQYLAWYDATHPGNPPKSPTIN